MIIDDEPLAANVLEQMINRDNPEITKLIIETDATKAMAVIEQFKPNLIFLDIVMPEITGFELLKKIQHKNFDVIFTTAFNEYAIQAIRFSALDYLLKPINSEELNAAIQRHIEKQAGSTDFESLYQNLLNNLKAKKEDDFKLAIPTMEGALFIKTDELIRCEGERNYTCFYLTNNRKHLSARTIKEYEEILVNHHFLRVHKSHLINQQFVTNYLNEGAIVMKDNSRIPVSRQRKDVVRKMLSNG